MSAPALGQNPAEQRQTTPPGRQPTPPEQPNSAGESSVTQRRKTTGYVYPIAFIAAMGGFLFGYDTGVVSGAQTFFSKDFHLSPTTQELAVSAVLIGAVIGAASGGKLADWVGRKATLISMGVVFAIGAILTAIAPDLALFVLFRVVVGFGIGASSILLAA